MAAQNLPMQMQKNWQTPPFNPQGGGPQGGQMMPPPQTLRSQIPPNPMQRQFEMMGGQKTEILNNQPQQGNWRDQLGREDFASGRFAMPEGGFSANDPNISIGPQAQQLDPTQAAMQPLEGEFIPSGMPDVPFNMQAPEGQYGLAGSEDALSRMLASQTGSLTQGAYDAFGTMQRGSDQARSDITGQLDQGLSALRAGVETGRGDVSQTGQSAISRFDPYAQTGQSALDIEAARSGALGPEAQAQAFADYAESPGQQWAREQQEQALIRNQASTGGSQSGNVLTALQEQAAGRSSQNYQQDLQNLRSLAERGQSAVGSQAGIETQMGRDMAQMAMTGGQSELSARQDAGSQMAQLAQQTGMSQSQLQQMLGQNLSNVTGQAGTNVANLRSQAGRDIANQLNLSGDQLARLQSGQGTNLANIDQQTAANLANISGQQGQQTSGLRTGLAAMLANLATGQGSQQANLALQAGDAQAGGVTNPWGNTASTLTGLIASNPQLISQMLPQFAPPPATSYQGAPIGPVQ